MPAAELIALARTPEKASGLGVSVRQADYEKPETLGPALTGVDTLLLTSGSVPGVRLAQHRNVIQAAKKVGSRASSTPACCTPTPRRWTLPPTTARRRPRSRPPVSATPSCGTAGTPRTTPARLPRQSPPERCREAPPTPESSAPRGDYAEAAAAVLVRTGHGGRTYELAGDEAWTMSDLADEISRQTGRTIVYQDLPPAEYATVLTSAGLPEELAQGIVGWDVAAAQGALFDGSRQLSKLIGRPTTRLSAAVADALQREGISR